jgi:hypothetical protein
MNTFIGKSLILMSALLSGSALASQGEYWEVTSKMEMEGMPFAMPAQTVKVCVPKGQDMDPRKANQGKECQFSDYKASGKKVTYKFRCEEKGEVITGDAEYTLGTNKSEGVMHMNSKGNGHEMKMTQNMSSKLVGGSCDPDQIARDNQERIDKMKRDQAAHTEKECDTSAYTTSKWIENSWKFTHNNHTCPSGNQQKEMCAAINKDTPRDADIYLKIVRDEDLISLCKVNIPSATKSICKTLNEKNLYQLTPYCPGEVKSYREAQRRKDCEGRSFTAETRDADMRKCLSGMKEDESTDDSANTPATRRKQGQKAAPENTQEEPSGSSSTGTATTDILNGAKKLKGLFGF